MGLRRANTGLPEVRQCAAGGQVGYLLLGLPGDWKQLRTPNLVGSPEVAQSRVAIR